MLIWENHNTPRRSKKRRNAENILRSWEPKILHSLPLPTNRNSKTHKTKVLPAVLYQREIVLFPCVEHRTKVFGKRELPLTFRTICIKTLLKFMESVIVIFNDSHTRWKTAENKSIKNYSLWYCSTKITTLSCANMKGYQSICLLLLGNDISKFCRQYTVLGNWRLN
jgi:hypothetical protein